MNTTLRRVVIAAATVSMAATMAACGKAGSSNSGAASVSKGFRIGIALPENQTARYEAYDKPMLEAKLKQLCPKCQVDYENAAQNANTQQQQVDTLINDGDKVIILDAVDYKAIQPSVQKAHDKGVKIVAYDRLAQGPVDAYTSFDNEKVGEQQGQALLAAMGSKATPSSQIVMVDGDKGDPNAAQFKAGAHKVLDGKVKIAAEYDTNGWLANNANSEVSGAIARIGAKNIAAIYSANDGMAAGVISALQSAHVSPLPPVSGQDSQLDGVQRVVAGTQAFTIYKPYRDEANTAAEMAVDLATGKSVSDVAPDSQSSATNKDIPSKLIATQVLTQKNVKQTVIDGGLYTVSQICAGQYASACSKIGLS
ncbi:substrate-binding domain-containing protein [Streptomyces sp. PTM05]|uniref:Substrate-binding domain-containing protein n=1 Tax=Streptantibioticus parmotrematis TaxID=2873249 RepID=A0ABS7QSN0_9ACTN|nr:substrate-binding domain-containing protein [Streptantibioticus parmotrematis]MBY8885709.1 substrate-binding domain-containing protein [Streptantibioticus parmotrematis]